jgi:Tfp pilus assembly protein PilV
MVDVLVALLLLAVALAGACAALLHALRTTHEALLTTRAVDLAADLTEDLRSVTSVTEAAQRLSGWRQQVIALLPVAGMRPEDIASLEPMPLAAEVTAAGGPYFELTLRWNSRSSTTSQELRLPVVLAAVSS